MTKNFFHSFSRPQDQDCIRTSQTLYQELPKLYQDLPQLYQDLPKLYQDLPNTKHESYNL